MAAARQKLMKLSITVVATKTLIAGRLVAFTGAGFRFPGVIPILSGEPASDDDALKAAHGSRFPLDFCNLRQQGQTTAQPALRFQFGSMMTGYMTLSGNVSVTC
jgi:hypothetical protein